VLDHETGLAQALNQALGDFGIILDQQNANRVLLPFLANLTNHHAKNACAPGLSASRQLGVSFLSAPGPIFPRDAQRGQTREERSMGTKTLILAGSLAALIAAPALAHHSFAMFDADKTVELNGTVKEFQWTNPHSWLQVMVTDDKGVTKEWSLEMGSPGGLARNGWRPKTVVAGDKVTVSLHPLKDGSPGGQLLKVKLPDGRELE
jgi:hypothetical protein